MYSDILYLYHTTNKTTPVHGGPGLGIIKDAPTRRACVGASFMMPNPGPPCCPLLSPLLLSYVRLLHLIQSGLTYLYHSDVAQESFSGCFRGPKYSRDNEVRTKGE